MAELITPLSIAQIRNLPFDELTREETDRLLVSTRYVLAGLDYNYRNRFNESGIAHEVHHAWQRLLTTCLDWGITDTPGAIRPGPNVTEPF